MTANLVNPRWTGFACKVCDYRLATRRDLLSHYRVGEHLHIVVDCCVCNHRLNRPGDVRRHLREEHGWVWPANLSLPTTYLRLHESATRIHPSALRENSGTRTRAAKWAETHSSGMMAFPGRKSKRGIRWVEPGCPTPKQEEVSAERKWNQGARLRLANAPLWGEEDWGDEIDRMERDMEPPSDSEYFTAEEEL